MENVTDKIKDEEKRKGIGRRQVEKEEGECKGKRKKKNVRIEKKEKKPDEYK